jgi:hypothetical protein
MPVTYVTRVENQSNVPPVQSVHFLLPCRCLWTVMFLESHMDSWCIFSTLQICLSCHLFLESHISIIMSCFSSYVIACHKVHNVLARPVEAIFVALNTSLKCLLYVVSSLLPAALLLETWETAAPGWCGAHWTRYNWHAYPSNCYKFSLACCWLSNDGGC